MSPLPIGITASSTAGLPVVTGGTLYSDSTYFYRKFTANGTLSISGGTVPMDVLLVGGGVGGGRMIGAGAGGVRYVTGHNTSGNIAIEIGAGGAGQSSYSATGAPGITKFTGLSDTQYGSGDGGFPFNVELNQTAPGGSARVSGLGNAGGSGRISGTDNNNFGAANGGGGGAGGSGGAASASLTTANGGDGGAGTNAYSTWASATSSGISGRYAAGGGGGSTIKKGTPYVYFDAGTGAGSGGSGGGGSGSAFGNGGSGSVNTGSGGGGAGGWTAANGTGGNGGSGIVIVRYLKSLVAA